MPRPSRNVDERLLRAGRELFPSEGCAGLSVRKLAQRAEVNLGMFHYHFRTKDAFVRQLLQGIYDEMFADLTVAAGHPDRPLESLREAVTVIARFLRDQRAVFGRILADAVDGQLLAREFLQANVPRHLQVVAGLVEAAQRAGSLKPLPLPQAVSFLAGAVGAPLLLAGGAVDAGMVPRNLARQIEREVMSDAAIARRLDLALDALAVRRGARR